MAAKVKTEGQWGLKGQNDNENRMLHKSTYSYKDEMCRFCHMYRRPFHNVLSKMKYIMLLFFGSA